MLLAREALNCEIIARIYHCSTSNMCRTIIERNKSQYQRSILSKDLYFDKFRSIKNTTSLICYNMQIHKLVVRLLARFFSTIINYFENRYSKFESNQIGAVITDLNFQYQRFVHRLFPKSKIIINRLHIVQLAGWFLDNYRISLIISN